MAPPEAKLMAPPEAKLMAPPEAKLMAPPEAKLMAPRPVEVGRLDIDIAPHDPLFVYFQRSTAAVEVARLQMDSPALEQIKETGAILIAPLVSQGEIIGVISVGSRRSDQEYASDDRRLLDDLTSQAAPAVRVAQLVRQQQLAALERERIEQELRVARVIQQTLLPHEPPQVEGWRIGAHWQPARAVSGDFYDFIPLPDGRVGLVIADVTDKGVPAALVMATTRAILRATVERFDSPGPVLQRVNDILYPDIPPKMFVTCLYAILDPATGLMRYANAGHNLPFLQHEGGAAELRATGMPLGLMPGMDYEEQETIIGPGDRVVFYSDGIVEAHNPQRQMFSTPRLHDLLAGSCADEDIITLLMGELLVFTGADWEQEDDVTFVTVTRQPLPAAEIQQAWTSIVKFAIPSAPGNERDAMTQVAQAVAGMNIAPARLERVKTAVAEATMNAMEHGNKYDPDKPAHIEVLRSPEYLMVRITDEGGGPPIPHADAPDLEAKLSGMQSPRGWGLFLIQSMVDDMHVITDDHHHTLELLFSLEGDSHV
jgi:serine phosphatase RsbU (regulator of sigma subunit)/anti-sigma regulatory factor (Ser/Thr protein kinase)